MTEVDHVHTYFACCLFVGIRVCVRDGFGTEHRTSTGSKYQHGIWYKLPGGDPYLQRQNQPSLAVSTRNPMHLLAGANDYRSVDMPGAAGETVIGDTWLGVFKSFDGGQTWQSTLLPGFPQEIGSTSPLKGLSAAADPTIRAGHNGMFYYSGIAFNRAESTEVQGATAKKGKLFVARFIDLNNREGTVFDIANNRDPIKYIDIMSSTLELQDSLWISPGWQWISLGL